MTTNPNEKQNQAGKADENSQRNPAETQGQHGHSPKPGTGQHGYANTEAGKKSGTQGEQGSTGNVKR